MDRSQNLHYCVSVRNITVSVPEEVYRAARIRAAEEGTSISALVAEFLNSLTEREAQFVRLQAKQLEIQKQIRRFRASDRLNRDEIHDRAIC